MREQDESCISLIDTVMKYRTQLPQLNGKRMLTDGGLETVLIFQQGIDLPLFAAFTLLDREGGSEILTDYFRPYAEIARRHKTGLIIDSPTWKANAVWGAQLGYNQKQLDDINRRGIELLDSFRSENETEDSPIVVAGCLGPRDDGYATVSAMTAEEAETYHSHQVLAFSESGADQVSAMTMNYSAEAIGVVRAAEKAGVPITISFTVETDGKLPDGESLEDAISRCDRETGSYAGSYMVNCAHPTHFANVIQDGGDWLSRFGGVRANASKMSHEELDEAEELDEGNPAELGSDISHLLAAAPSLQVFGGCCGTDHRHVEAIAREVAPIQ